MRQQRGFALLLPPLLAAGSLALAPSRPMVLTTENWTPAQETGYAGNVGWQRPFSPEPTEPPKPNDFGAMELFKRSFSVGSDTCGFISGFSSNAVTCVKVGAYCTNDGTSIIACCSGDYTSCLSTMATSCVPFSASSTGCTSRGAKTMCCGSANPSCYTILSQISSTTYSVLECQTYGTTPDILLPLPPVATMSTSSSSSTSTTSSSSTTTSTSSSTTSSAPASTTASSDNGGGSSTPVGAIVGGTVGGVAVVAAISLFAFWMIVRRRREASATPYQPVQQPQQAQPGAPGYPSPGQEYAAQQHYSMTQYPPSTYKPDYTYQPVQQNPGAYPYPPSSTSPVPGYAPPSVSPETGGHPAPAGYHPQELPVQFAVGSQGNRAELPH